MMTQEEKKVWDKGYAAGKSSNWRDEPTPPRTLSSEERKYWYRGYDAAVEDRLS